MNTSWTSEELYKSLKELNIIAIDRLDDAMKKSKIDQTPLDEILLEKDLIADEDLGRTIAEILQLPFVKLSSISISPEILGVIPEDFAHKHKIIIFGEDESQIFLTFTKPFEPKILDLLEKKTGKKIKLHYTTMRELEFGFENYEKDLQKTFENILKTMETLTPDNPQNDVPVIQLFNKLIEHAYKNMASDIHIEPEKNKSIVRLRIDGVLNEVLYFSHEFHDRFISRIKYLAKLRTDEHMSAQDGKFQIPLEQEELDVRVSIIPIVHGEKCVLRLLALRYRQFSLSDLGLSKTDLEKIKKSFGKPYGMILTTGPTGAGKTTTMYSILKILNTPQRNIATIEDPVEYDIEGVNQIQVNTRTNLTFAEGLRSILRQDPNIIYVGEIRDNETADISINSALTGHLVLSTLHTNDAATALPRFMEMKIEPYLLSSTISVVVAQRLIRKLCMTCMVSYLYKVSELQGIVPSVILKKIAGTKKELRFYKGKGCKVCHNTGYQGRVGIFEILEITPEIQQLIINKKDASEIKKQALAEGMTTMLEDGLQKVLQGMTSIDEVIHATLE